MRPCHQQQSELLMPASTLMPEGRFLRACLAYDAVTGDLQWKLRPRSHFATTPLWEMWNTKYAGKLAGSRHKAKCGYYRAITLDGVPYLVHRVIWKMMTDKDPMVEIDHRNT